VHCMSTRMSLPTPWHNLILTIWAFYFIYDRFERKYWPPLEAVILQFLTQRSNSYSYSQEELNR
jgi:hypothetical protein